MGPEAAVFILRGRGLVWEAITKLRVLMYRGAHTFFTTFFVKAFICKNFIWKLHLKIFLLKLFIRNFGAGFMDCL